MVVMMIIRKESAIQYRTSSGYWADDDNEGGFELYGDIEVNISPT